MAGMVSEPSALRPEPTGPDLTPPDRATADVAEVTPLDEPLIGTRSIDAALTPDTSEPPRSIPVLSVDKVERGNWTVRGIVPDRRSKDALVTLIEERAGSDQVEVDVALADEPADDDWLRFARERIQALDEVQAGRLSLEDDRAHLIGVVATAEQVPAVQAALADIDRDMKVDLQPVDPRPIASLNLRMSPGWRRPSGGCPSRRDQRGRSAAGARHQALCRRTRREWPGARRALASGSLVHRRPFACFRGNRPVARQPAAGDQRTDPRRGRCRRDGSKADPCAERRPPAIGRYRGVDDGSPGRRQADQPADRQGTKSIGVDIGFRLSTLRRTEIPHRFRTLAISASRP